MLVPSVLIGSAIMARFLLRLFLVAVFSSGPGVAMAVELPAKPNDSRAQAKAASHDVGPLCRRLWTLTEVVLENHIDPPSRQEMFLAAARGILKAADQIPPHGLGRR